MRAAAGPCVAVSARGSSHPVHLSGPVLRAMSRTCSQCAISLERGTSDTSKCAVRPQFAVDVMIRAPRGPHTRRHARQARTTVSIVLSECLLGVLLVAAQVGSAQAYGCTSDVDCQYPKCNDNSCACSSSSTECRNGFWTGYSSCRNGVWDAVCYSGSCLATDNKWGADTWGYHGSDPLPCVAGKKSSTGKNGAGNSACQSCSPGKYFTITGASACVDCGAGKYSNVTGASSDTVCTNCDAPSGHVCLAGSTSRVSVKCGSHLMCPGGSSGGMPVAVIFVGSVATLLLVGTFYVANTKSRPERCYGCKEGGGGGGGGLTCSNALTEVVKVRAVVSLLVSLLTVASCLLLAVLSGLALHLPEISPEGWSGMVAVTVLASILTAAYVIISPNVFQKWVKQSFCCLCQQKVKLNQVAPIDIEASRSFCPHCQTQFKARFLKPPRESVAAKFPENSQISQQASALVETRDCDRAELYAKLQDVAALNNQHVELQTATGDTAKTGDKYLQARLLEYGPAQASTLGLVNFMGVDQESFYVRYSAGVDEMVREVKDRSQVEEQRSDIENDRRALEILVAKGALAYAVQSKQDEIDVKTKETDELEEMLVKAERVFLHILNEEAGSCNEAFQNGWKMDCDPKTGEVLPERLVDDGEGGKRGMRADDFWKDPNSVECGHTKAEVISGRFYTTFGFNPINIPLRDPKRKDKKGKIFKPVLYPVITYHLNSFIKKCRTLAAGSQGKNSALDLYRGMSNVCLQDGFMKEGGSELAPMSTTADLAIALKYSAGGQKAVLLRIRTTNFMDRGAALRWISAFPHEEEYLYPPITFLKPKYETPEIFKIGDVEFEVVDVTAQIP